MTATTMPLASRPARAVQRGLMLALGAVSAGGLAAAGWLAWAKHDLAAQHPPPGRLVDVGGYALHIDCRGPAGGPTVLLEAGNADFSVHWSAVQDRIAGFAHVCAYDRAGLGWSEPATGPRTIGAMSRELASLLQGAGIDGPLVLVGHSFGALVSLSFAAEHTDRVAGLVLIDPAHPDQLERLPALARAVDEGVAQFGGLVPLADWGLLAAMPGNIPNRGLPAEAHADYAAVLATKGYFAAAAAETATLPANLAAVGEIGGRLGDLPVSIVSRGLPEAPAGLSAAEVEAFEAGWAELQGDVLGVSTNARQVVAGASGHYVQLAEPELVVEAVRDALAALPE